jgi:phosphoribosylformylglycinamidine synthase
LGISGVQDVRVGKQINLSIVAADAAAAESIAQQAAQQLLANPVMEFFEVSVSA